jgi:hypothetical protein
MDVASLYPTMAMKYNVPFDTINCGCCKDRVDLRVPLEIIDKGYWIYKNRIGAFPAKLKGFTIEERLRQKRLGNDIMAKGLKILISMEATECSAILGSSILLRTSSELITACIWKIYAKVDGASCKELRL